VASSAASLAEVGGLLMAEGRARDSGRWMKISQALINASLVSMRAAEAEDKDALLASGEALNATCEDCHRIYSVDLPR
jgi:cytochrome c556